MQRHRLGAWIAVTLLLAGCSDDGTPGPDVRSDATGVDGQLGDGSTERMLTDGATDKPVVDGRPADRNHPPPDQALPDKGKPDGTKPGCLPMVAQGVGGCAMVLGVTWDGSACVSISGCSCQGSDCTKLYQTTQACQAATSICP